MKANEGQVEYTTINVKVTTKIKGVQHKTCSKKRGNHERITKKEGEVANFNNRSPYGEGKRSR